MDTEQINKRATREEIEAVLRCESKRKTPLFMPAIYEHKAWFIDSTPSMISRDPDLFTKALLAEYEQVGADALAVGVDVYNLEAEAAGCKVTFYEGDDSSIPGIAPGNHIVKLGDDLKDRAIPNPLKDGRMPVNVEVAKRLVQELGKDVWVRGSISGPFSLAISLMGAEDLFMSTLDDPEFAHDILGYSSRIIKEFAKAYIDVGASLIVFDSQASCDLLPPDMYKDFVVPQTKELMDFFKEQGVNDVPLIIGGNTTDIVDELIATNANNLLCDFTSDRDVWYPKCREANRAVRRNISPRLLETATPDEIYEAAREEIKAAGGYPGFIMGTAVVAYGTPTEKLLAVKQACLDAEND